MQLPKVKCSFLPRTPKIHRTSPIPSLSYSRIRVSEIKMENFLKVIYEQCFPCNTLLGEQ